MRKSKQIELNLNERGEFQDLVTTLFLPTTETTLPHMRDIYMWAKLENKELNYALKECL